MCNVFEKFQRLKQSVDEWNSEIEAEQQKELEEWIRKQERNDEQLYLHIQKIEEKLEDQQEFIESELISTKHEQEEKIEEIEEKNKHEMKVIRNQLFASVNEIWKALLNQEKVIEEQKAQIKMMDTAHKQEIQSIKRELMSEFRTILDVGKLVYEAKLNSLKEEQEEMRKAHNEEMKALRIQMHMEISETMTRRSTPVEDPAPEILIRADIDEVWK